LYGVAVAEKGDRGIFVTTGTYTPDALAFARGKPLELVDGEALARLVEDVSTAGEAVRCFPATRISEMRRRDGAACGEARSERRQGFLGLS
jgi:restriction system protein